ncbi:MAG: hypothetical protein ACKVOW_09785 [Chitinophagaceae bacterium]
MRQKKITSLLFLVAALLVTIPSFARLDFLVVVPASVPVKVTETVNENNWSEQYKANPDIKTLSPEMIKMGLTQFLSLTPSKYKALTGKKLGLKKSIELRIAQKFLKKKMGKAADIPKGLYIVGAIIGFAWLLMGLMDDWQGNEWWICALLTICWLPGVIYAFIKMKKYYS